jgi:hypothetical protein
MVTLPQVSNLASTIIHLSADQILSIHLLVIHTEGVLIITKPEVYQTFAMQKSQLVITP